MTLAEITWTKPVYEVVVGNIGRVICTNDETEARKTYEEYVERSQKASGRAAYEIVTLFRDTEIEDEFLPCRV